MSDQLKQMMETKMREMLDLMQAGMTKQELLDAFQKIMELVRASEQNLAKRIDNKTKAANDRLQELDELYQETIKRINEENESSLSNIKRWALEGVNKFIVRSKINDKLEEVDKRLNELNSYELPDASAVALEAAEMAKDGLLPLIPIVEKVEEELPELGEAIRDGLEKLPEEEKLEIKAIKDLRQELDELRSLLKNKTVIMGGGGGGGRIVKAHDLSSSLNGVLKTFSLPAFWRVISVHSSSFPNAFRPTTDYTVDGSAMTITFTSEITASSTLAAGQTVIVTYAEA